LVDFLVKMWLAYDFLRFILPLAVSAKRFAAPLLVLILGTLLPFLSYGFVKSPSAYVARHP
jgi:hypothetical protein